MVNVYLIVEDKYINEMLGVTTIEIKSTVHCPPRTPVRWSNTIRWNSVLQQTTQHCGSGTKGERGTGQQPKETVEDLHLKFKAN